MPAQVAISLAAAFVTMAGFYGVVFVQSLYFQQVRAASPLETGLLFLPMTAMVAILNPTAAKTALRFGSRVPIIGGQVLMVAGLIGLAIAPVDLRRCPVIRWSNRLGWWPGRAHLLRAVSHAATSGGRGRWVEPSYAGSFPSRGSKKLSTAGTTTRNASDKTDPQAAHEAGHVADHGTAGGDAHRATDLRAVLRTPLAVPARGRGRRRAAARSAAGR